MTLRHLYLILTLFLDWRRRIRYVAISVAEEGDVAADLAMSL